MADFKNLTLTTFGSALLEKAIAGTTLEFTRAAIGDGRVADGTDISGLTALVNEKKSIPINSIVFKDGLATVTIAFSNSDLSVGFHVRELGLFAKDPEKDEILYAVANAGDDADWLPEMGSNVVEEVFKIVPVVSGATKVTAVIDNSLTYVTKEEFAAHHHVAGGQNDGQPVEAKDVVSTPSGLITATTVQDSINQAGLSIAPPETDYIINSPSIGYGGNFTPNDDLSINVSALEAMIGRKYHKSEAVSDFTLIPRKASLIYATKNSDDSSAIPTLGHYDAVYPEADGNTVLRYVFNEASGQVIDSSGNLNHGTVTGTVTRQVDGWADYAVKGDGSTGYVTSTSSINFPTLALARTIDAVFTVNRISASEMIVEYGGTSSGTRFGIDNVSGELEIDLYSLIYDTGYTLEVGKTYYVSACYDGSKILVYVNGLLIFTQTVTLATTAGVLRVLTVTGTAAYFSSATMHYVELKSVCRTANEIAQISNRLCVPCSYTGYSTSYPTNDTTSGTHIYKFDDESGSIVTDENGALNGTATGTTIINSVIGLNYARKFNGSSDKITLGAFAYNSQFTVIFCGRPNTSKMTHILSNRDSANTIGYDIYISTGCRLGIDTTNAFQGNNAVFNTDKVSFAALVFDNGTAYMYENSKSITSVLSGIPVRTTNGTAVIGYDAPYAVSSPSIVYSAASYEYLLYVPKIMIQAEIAQYYNALMVKKERTLIDDCLPSNSISLGFARTGSSALIEYNDSDYRYMRNEGATKAEGNKRLFLGWQYYVNGQTKTWNNPFGTRKIRTYFVWAKDVNGTNEIDTGDFFYSSGSWGLVRSAGTLANRIAVTVCTAGPGYTGGGGVGAGYIGCYAEVL